MSNDLVVNKKVEKAKQALKDYKKEMNEALEQIYEKDGIDNAITRIQRDQLKRLLGLVPSAEKAFKDRPGQGAAVALNGIISQIREILYDIQSRKDYQQIVADIRSKILVPEFISLTQMVVDNMYRQQKALEPYIRDKDIPHARKIIEGQARDTALAMKQAMDMIGDRLEKKLLEED